MKTFICLILAVSISLVLGETNLIVDDPIDINEIVSNGVYYNILSKPDELDKLCYCTVAVYSWKEVNKRLNVDESCNLLSPTGVTITERSELALTNNNNGMLVRYDLQGIYNYPYSILQVADDYSWIAVGEPDRQSFWLLSNQPTLDQTIIDSVLQNQTQLNGYDFSDVMYTDQSCY